MILIKNGRIHVGDGRVLEAHDILIEGDRIIDIDKNIAVTTHKLINASGMEIYPGFIDPVSSYGCTGMGSFHPDEDEFSDPINLEAEVRYSLNHVEMLHEALYSIGLVTIGAAPGNREIIGGQMSALRTWGKSSADMVLRKTVGVKGSVTREVTRTFGERKAYPMTLMGVFHGLKSFLSSLAREDKDESSNRETVGAKLIDGKIPLFIRANTAMEIENLIEVTHSFGIRPIVCGAYQFDRCMDSIIRYRTPIVLGELTEYTAAKYNSTDLSKLNGLISEGIPFSFGLSSNFRPEGKQKYLWNAIELFRSGIGSEEIVRAMTYNPAVMLGIDDITGTLSKGKLADLVIYDADPIRLYISNVAMTFVSGELVYSRGISEC